MAATLLLSTTLAFGQHKSSDLAQQTLRHTVNTPSIQYTLPPPKIIQTTHSHSAVIAISIQTQDLGGKLDETLTLVGAAVAQLANNTATALKSAQTALDEILPGPSMQQVLIDLRWVAVCMCILVWAGVF